MTEPVNIEEYDSLWPQRFEDEAALVRTILGDVEIEHHGSTAIPGLPAKPIIDMMVSIATIEEGKRHAAKLVRSGYEEVDRKYRKLMPERIVLIRRCSAGLRQCHAHLLLRHHRMWNRQIAFRDYLRDNPEAAREYACLKRSLAKKFRDSRHEYMMAKTDFIKRITELALSSVEA